MFGRQFVGEYWERGQYHIETGCFLSFSEVCIWARECLPDREVRFDRVVSSLAEFRVPGRKVETGGGSHRLQIILQIGFRPCCLADWYDVLSTVCRSELPLSHDPIWEWEYSQVGSVATGVLAYRPKPSRDGATSYREPSGRPASVLSVWPEAVISR